ncbi:PREDICTED: vesicle transport protein USE1 [Nicrophorus vespilloides]|uniref:Vesicle transport protein USE1 n=1 Tax=Nicrophorus vespilloides TaxID=110193 RepID=A0ABM1MLM0_NICVS|nr:PREDICTED: vesicle transport protein USE1 [Nicrophorus vespilloides]
MGLTRQEVNLRRLLLKCELMISSNQKDDRFPKYVNSLEDMLKDMLKVPEKPHEEILNDYKRRIYNVKVSAGMETDSDRQFLLNEKINEEPIARMELLGLRQRKADKQDGLDDLDQMIHYHQDAQEKIANDMLQLTQSLKEQSQLANKIIKKDTEVVSKSSQMTEQNFSRLKVESSKLTEHSKRACKCWMWIMLVIVLAVFINMVLFMKVMKKTK